MERIQSLPMVGLNLRGNLLFKSMQIRRLLSVLHGSILNMVYDQIGTPTYARDLAKTILEILSSKVITSGVEVFHYSNEGVASWYDFAKAIVDYSGIECKINPIRSKDYIQAAPRPFYSVLDKSQIKERFSIEIPDWRD